MTTVRIGTCPPEQAEAVVAAHLELHPGHVVTVYLCAGCLAPIGVLCTTCAEPVCAVDSPDCGDPGVSRRP